MSAGIVRGLPVVARGLTNTLTVFARSPTPARFFLPTVTPLSHTLAAGGRAPGHKVHYSTTRRMMETASVKRRHPSVSESGRPSKQPRKPSPPPDMHRIIPQQNGHGEQPNGHSSQSYDWEEDEPQEVVVAPPAPVDTPEWQATLEKVVSNVVSIHFCQTCAFDTDAAMTSEATGFVVDAEKGYIMTNRHVVGSGPFWGYCIFDNHEECDVFPVYRDPVHDFGILRFDPKAVKYQNGTSLTLRPDLAKVGVEIRIVGNDAGEKLSIHSGVISRLDRNAPETQGYTDFNTNYIQAATSMVGGSSGSPVINVDGFAIAIQAAGNTDAATDFFLPLDRPLRALECIRKGQPVKRGDIQVQWMIKPFDECSRLGLSEAWETKARTEFPKETGMLVAEVVLPDGPAHQKLQEGDVLLRVNGEMVTQLIRLDDIMDNNVHDTVKLLVQRGGADVEVQVEVGDLHAITPSRFVTVAGATFHDLSYQQARAHAVSLKGAGVYCCDASGSFRFEYGHNAAWLVQSIDNKPTPDLDTFIDVVKMIPDRSRVIITAKQLRDMHTLDTSVVFVDRHWNRHMRLGTRNDTSGFWDFTDLAEPIAPATPVPRKAKFTQMEGSKHPAAADMVRSFVKVTTTIPLKIDGNDKPKRTGTGLVIDAEKGLVVVSRATAPYDLCDITITIADSIIVDGKVKFMHPLQNYAILQYDPSLVLAPVKSAKLSTKPIKQGEETIFFGFNAQLRPLITTTTVTDITTVTIPASATPRYRAVNVDAITVDTVLGGGCGSGVLVAEDGTVQALWLTYLGDRQANHSAWYLGFATPALLPVIDEVKSGVKPDLSILDLETQSVPMSQCRIMGVSEEWIERVENEDSGRHHLFLVRKVDAGSMCGFMEGDIILTLNDELITRISGFDVMYNHSTLRAVVVRKQQEINIEVRTVPTSALETNRVVNFCGAILQPPHHAVRQQISKVHSEIYISGCVAGSPAEMYKLAPTCFIMDVNNVPTHDLTEFVRETEKIPNNTYFRLKMMTFDNVPWVATMKKCEHYFPTVEFFKDDDVREGWRRVTYEGGEVKRGEGDAMPEGTAGHAHVA